ncbi:MAG: hypothetical protein DMG24_12190 [Acidobacteria bacterium]|nr:MAG: hypothetical protein DMG24_12190 [Acidobacteriota bacterium]
MQPAQHQESDFVGAPGAREDPAHDAGRRGCVPLRARTGIPSGAVAYAGKFEEVAGVEGRSQAQDLLAKPNRKPRHYRHGGRRRRGTRGVRVFDVGPGLEDCGARGRFAPGGRGGVCDDNAGAASATGDGDLMTNYCTSVSIVHTMSRGASPQDACVELLQHMVKTDPANKSGDVCVIALNNRGEVGAASMRAGYRLKYALWRNGESHLLDAIAVY